MGDGRPELLFGVGTSFFSCPLQFFPYSLFFYFLPPCLCPISVLLVPWQVFRKTLVHKFHISYSHTEWCLLFREARWSCLGRKLTMIPIIIIHYMKKNFLSKSVNNRLLKQHSCPQSAMKTSSTCSLNFIFELEFSNLCFHFIKLKGLL